MTTRTEDLGQGWFANLNLAADDRTIETMTLRNPDKGQRIDLDSDSVNTLRRIFAAVDAKYRTHFIAIGPGCWGRAESIKGAIANMNKAAGKPQTIYVLWHVHKDTTVDNGGQLCQPMGLPAPSRLEEVGFSK